MTFFPCHVNMPIPNTSKQSSCLGICPASLGTEAHAAHLGMIGGAKVALRGCLLLENPD